MKTSSLCHTMTWTGAAGERRMRAPIKWGGTAQTARPVAPRGISSRRDGHDIRGRGRASLARTASLGAKTERSAVPVIDYPVAETIESPEDAIETIRRVHDELVDIFMITVDLLDDNRKLNMKNFRRGSGEKLRQGIADREEALAVLTVVAKDWESLAFPDASEEA